MRDLILEALANGQPIRGGVEWEYDSTEVSEDI